MINIPDNNADSHCFVSVDKDDNVIGYISYNVDWSAMSADNWGIISFDKGNLIFASAYPASPFTIIPETIIIAA